MSERRYQLNRKCFAATRILGKGKDADPKWNYMYVSPKGVICTDRIALIRVSLPQQANAPETPCVFTGDVLEENRPATGDEIVLMPEGREAKCDGTLAVPNFSSAIPESSTQVASITITAKHLIEILKAACEVTDHARNLVRLRICGDGNKNQQLRVDAHCDKGSQEFTGVIMGTVYTGTNIRGDPINPNQGLHSKTEMIDERKLTLPLTEGRKFRRDDES
jgi:hypothetical protein